MAGKIPQAFIDNLLDRVDIVEVVSARINLRKSGKNYSACCPFHDEKTPSFTVSPDKQFYYCFGCGAGGNSIGFVMDYERIGFVETVEQLAKSAGLQVPREAAANREAERKKDDLYGLMENISQYYRQQLRQHPDAGKAVDYLKQRGLSGEIARRFGLGFALPGWENLRLKFGADHTGQQQLLQTGMLIENPDQPSVYDRFRNRIMFPIRDLRGRIIAFGGRVLDDSKPKYLNSPETAIFHKGRELYGLYEANQALRDIPNLLVVEGYMDVVALAQFGVLNAVATLGTAVTQEHMEKLFRYTSEVVFCFDGDNAGRSAAHRALETVLPVMIDGRSARFLFLPEGEDPDTLVRNIGAPAFLELVSQADTLSDFLLQSCADNLDLNSLDGKARLSKRAAPMINRLPKGVLQEMMLNQLARITELAVDRLRTLLASPSPAPQEKKHAPPPATYREEYADHRPLSDRPSAPRQTRKQFKLPAEKMLITLLLNQPGLIKLAPDSEQLAALKQLQNETVDLLCDLIALIREYPDYTLNHILGYWRGVYSQQHAAQLAELAAADLMDPAASEFRQDDVEFSALMQKLLLKASSNKPPLALLEQLATAATVSEAQLKAAKTAWATLLETPDKERSTQLLHNIIVKPRN